MKIVMRSFWSPQKIKKKKKKSRLEPSRITFMQCYSEIYRFMGNLVQPCIFAYFPLCEDPKDDPIMEVPKDSY